MTFGIGAYYTAWSTYDRKFQVTDIDASKLSHVFYSFFNLQPNGEVVSGDAWADYDNHFPTDSWNDQGKNLYGNLKQLFELKKKNRHLKVSLAVGGWSWSGNFSDVAANPQTRNVFVRSCLAHLTNLGLDGICVDWEYPVIAGLEGNKCRPKDGSNLVLLLRELREALDAHANEKGEYPNARYLLSCCLPAARDRLSVLQLNAMSSFLDEFHLMSYDFSGKWSPHTDHHANLFGGALSADAAVTYTLSQGVPPRKLHLGAPMYGRAFCNTSGMKQGYNGIGQADMKNSWEDGVWDYKALPLQGSDESCDATVGGAYCYDPDARRVITYDNPQTIAMKVEYVKSRGLGGIFFWELSGDHDPRKNSDRSLLAATFGAFGGSNGMDSTANHLNFPTSVYDNIRKLC